MPRGGKREGAGARKLPEGEKQKKISVSLSPKTLAKLEQYTKKQGKSRSWVIDTAINEFMEKHPPSDSAAA